MDEREMIEKNVRESAYHIIGYKGATSFGVGMALIRITEAVLRSQHSVLTVSTLLNGEFGVRDICLSVPCIVSGSGVERIVESKLTDQEQERLTASAEALRKAMEGLGIA
jgi:L-lactate dehydrogenase